MKQIIDPKRSGMDMAETDWLMPQSKLANKSRSAGEFVLIRETLYVPFVLIDYIH